MVEYVSVCFCVVRNDHILVKRMTLREGSRMLKSERVSMLTYTTFPIFALFKLCFTPSVMKQVARCARKHL